MNNNTDRNTDSYVEISLRQYESPDANFELTPQEQKMTLLMNIVCV